MGISCARRRTCYFYVHTHTLWIMPAPIPSANQTASAAVLLVLLPVAVGSARPGRLAVLSALELLQQQLGPAVRVLTIEGAAHPAVVRSFQATELPAFVLVRQGVELWRQQGLPEAETIVPLLLSKLSASPTA